MQRMKRSAAKDGAGAGGSNILRGGKNTYSSKAKLDNWVEEEYKPEINVGNFSASKYESTAAFGQRDGLVGNKPTFGAGLKAPEPEDFDYGNIVCADKRNTDKTWKTVTTSVHGDTFPSEFSTTFHLTGGIQDKKELDNYRKQWSTDEELLRTKRFVTEATATQTTAGRGRFANKQVRALAGIPKTVEKIQQKILEKGGETGIRAVRSLFAAGDSVLSQAGFAQGLKNFGLQLSAMDIETAFKYFDKDGSGELSVSEFMTAMCGNLTENRRGLIGLAFDMLDRTGEGTVLVEDLASYDANGHPNVQMGKQQPGEVKAEFMSQWSGDSIVFDQFLEYYRDISAAIPDDDYFEMMVRNSWKF